MPNSCPICHAITGIKRLWRNFITARYRPLNGWAPPPSLVTLRPTDDCTLRCKMCCERGEKITSASWVPEAPEGFMSAEDYKALIDDLALFRPTFYITGGEPLLSDKLDAILKAIKCHGLYVSVNTNGTLLKDKAKTLVDLGVDRIILSLDGPPETHDAIRGKSFEAIAEGVKVLRDTKRTAGKRTPTVRGQCVISPHNLDRLHDTIAVAEALGLKELRFQHLMFAFTEENYSIDEFLKSIARSVEVSDFILPSNAIDTAVLTDQVARILSDKRPGIKTAFEPPIRSEDLDGYYHDRTHGFANLCLGPWRRLVVSSRGEMGPCQGVFLGRYPDMMPAALWWGQDFRALRRHVIEHGLFQYCTRCCHREFYGAKGGLTIS